MKLHKFQIDIDIIHRSSVWLWMKCDDFFQSILHVLCGAIYLVVMSIEDQHFIIIRKKHTYEWVTNPWPNKSRQFQASPFFNIERTTFQILKYYWIQSASDTMAVTCLCAWTTELAFVHGRLSFYDSHKMKWNEIK